MTSHWEMRVALAAVEAEALAIAPLLGWGLVLPVDGGCVSYQMCHPWGTHVNILPVEDLPAGLRTPISGVRQIGPIAQDDGPIEASHGDAGHRDAGGRPVAGRPRTVLGRLGIAGRSPRRRSRRSRASRIGSPSGRASPNRTSRARCRLERLESLSDVLPLIARALDLRDVFERLSDVARRALPHDTCVVGIHSEDHTQVRLHALSGAASLVGLPEVVPNPYPKALAVSREFAIIRDLVSHPFEQAGVGAKLGLRSALRLPLSLDGRVKGVLDFSSFEAGRYSEADLPIARRIADYVTLALSHKEIADQAQRAATLAERAANLNALEELLSTLTSVLDVRQVVDRVSEIAQTVLPHDAMSIPLLIEGADRVRVYANSGLGDAPTPYETAIPDPTLLTRPWEFQIFDDLREVPPAAFDRPIKAGMRSALLVPIKMGGQLRGARQLLLAHRRALHQGRRADCAAGGRSHRAVAVAPAARRGGAPARGAARADGEPRAARRAAHRADRYRRAAAAVRSHLRDRQDRAAARHAGAAGPAARRQACAGLRQQRRDARRSRKSSTPRRCSPPAATGNST